MTLQAGGSYYLVSQEFNGADRWIDLGPVTARPVATIDSGVYSSLTDWYPLGPPNFAYVPPNFK